MIRRPSIVILTALHTVRTLVLLIITNEIVIPILRNLSIVRIPIIRRSHHRQRRNLPLSTSL
jgi:hypothetical protein